MSSNLTPLGRKPSNLKVTNNVAIDFGVSTEIAKQFVKGQISLQELTAISQQNLEKRLEPQRQDISQPMTKEQEEKQFDISTIALLAVVIGVLA